MASDEEFSIDCEVHGRGLSAIVCRHLISDSGIPLGFVENSSVPGNLQAWCQKCEKLFLKETALTENFLKFSDLACVCEKCYAEISKKHRYN
jgi:hypothetical protein